MFTVNPAAAAAAGSFFTAVRIFTELINAVARILCAVRVAGAGDTHSQSPLSPPLPRKVAFNYAGGVV